MSYLNPIETSSFSRFSNMLTFGLFKPAKPMIKFMNIEYNECDEEYKGISGIFDNSSEGVWPICDIVFPTGIPNLGNTCYMNALMQALIACDQFAEYVNIFKSMMIKVSTGDNQSSNSDGSDSDDDKYFKLTDSEIEEHYILKSFIDAFYALKRGSTDSDKISTFYEHLCETFTCIFEQEDAHELLMVLFSVIKVNIDLS